MEEGKEDAGAVVGFAFRARRGKEREMKEEKKQPLTLPPTSPHLKKIFFPVPKKRSPFLKKSRHSGKDKLWSQGIGQLWLETAGKNEAGLLRRSKSAVF